MSVTPSEAEVRCFYTAALVGLRFIEQSKPTDRRFGENADARWRAFKGDLTTSDRIDLLIRDADAHWTGSFGARTVFAMDAVSEDDPFGPSWPSLTPVDAEEVWRGQLDEASPSSVAEALTKAAEVWGLSVSPIARPEVGAADKLLVVGPGAVMATAQAFAEGSDLDWADQVVCIATPSAHRQLAAMAAGLLGASRASALHTAHAEPAGKLEGRRLILSNDADAEDSLAAQDQTG